MVVDVKYNRGKAKKYGLKEDGDFVERYLTKRVDNNCLLSAEIDAKPYEGRVYLDVAIYYDPSCPGVEGFLEKLEMFLMTRVEKIVVWKIPKKGNVEGE